MGMATGSRCSVENQLLPLTTYSTTIDGHSLVTRSIYFELPAALFIPLVIKGCSNHPSVAQLLVHRNCEMGAAIDWSGALIFCVSLMEIIYIAEYIDDECIGVDAGTTVCGLLTFGCIVASVACVLGCFSFTKGEDDNDGWSDVPFKVARVICSDLPLLFVIISWALV